MKMEQKDCRQNKMTVENKMNVVSMEQNDRHYITFGLSTPCHPGLTPTTHIQLTEAGSKISHLCI